MIITMIFNALDYLARISHVDFKKIWASLAPSVLCLELIRQVTIVLGTSVDYFQYESSLKVRISKTYRIDWLRSERVIFSQVR
jgi:hypothetical protein